MIAVPSPSIAFSIKDDGRDVSEDVSPCLRSMNAAESNANAGGQVAVAFCKNTRDEVRLFGGDGQSVGSLGAKPGMKQQCFAAVPSVASWAVRKLTPRQCESLTGLHDDFTRRSETRSRGKASARQ